MTAVRCVDLCRTYRQGDQDIKALDHVSIDIESGDFVCLSAPSGGGKTTLLNAIGGLDRPDSGEIYIADERIDTLSKAELADLRLRRIGFVFQAYNLVPVLTARENIEFVMQVQGVAASERRERSEAILSEVGLALCAASSKSDQTLISEILAEHGRDGFLAAWLDARGVGWAADLIPDLTNLIPEPEAPDALIPQAPEPAEETTP